MDDVIGILESVLPIAEDARASSFTSRRRLRRIDSPSYWRVCLTRW